MKKNYLSPSSAILKKACDALDIQLNCLKSLKDIFDNNFLSIIDILLKNTGKIIVTGIGKSSYIAQKMSATLSSTGSKAIFVHPSEASHGDLGIIDINDIIIIFSKSGESHELNYIINYSNDHNIPIITITNKPDSSIAKKSDYLLLLNHVKEFSVINAPTTSTSMMLVIADIIAICLSEEKNFNQDDYRKIHPSGQIGKDLVQVKNLMHIGEEIPTANQEMLMDEVILIMTSKKFGCAVILDDNNLVVGIITDGDLRRYIKDDLFNKKAYQIMTKDLLYVEKNMLVKDALKLMNQYNIICLIVKNSNNQVEGIIHIHDCLRMSK